LNNSRFITVKSQLNRRNIKYSVRVIARREAPRLRREAAERKAENRRRETLANAARQVALEMQVPHLFAFVSSCFFFVAPS
jgi:hypothetical protein